MLTRYNPFQLAESLFREPFFGAFAQAPADENQPVVFSPLAEVEETDHALVLRVDLPGHDPKNIKVEVENDTLTLRSERKDEHTQKKAGAVRTEWSYGTYARSFVLPDTVDGQKCEAKYENGVLQLTFPKREEVKPKTITVKVS